MAETKNKKKILRYSSTILSSIAFLVWSPNGTAMATSTVDTPIKIIGGQIVTVLSTIQPGTFLPGSVEWNETFAADQASSRDPAPVTVNLDNATHIDVTYKGKFLGFDFGRAFISADFNDQAYQMAYKVQTEGATALANEPNSDALSWGTLTNSIMTSLFYYKETYEKKTTSLMELTRLGPDTRFRSWSDPQFTLYHPVMPEIALNTVDPVGVLALLGFVKGANGANPCDRAVPVYDGRRRYNLWLEAAGTKVLKRRPKKRYEGFTYRCRVFMEKVAGYNEKNLNEEDDIEAYVYLAPLPEEIQTANFAYLPVLLEAKAGGLTARIEAKAPIITLPDGTVVNMGRK